MTTKVFRIMCVLIIALAAIFGFICPYLISANSDALVGLGCALIFGVFYLAGSRITKIVDGENK